MQKCTWKWINIQNVVFAFLYLIFLKYVIICKQIVSVCLQIFLLILLICESMGFRSWNPCFHNLKPLVLHPETHAFRLWFDAFQKTHLKGLKNCINIQKKPHPRAARSAAFPSPLERGVNSLANYSRTVASVPRPPAPNICSPWEALCPPNKE